MAPARFVVRRCALLTGRGARPRFGRSEAPALPARPQGKAEERGARGFVPFRRTWAGGLLSGASGSPPAGSQRSCSAIVTGDRSALSAVCGTEEAVMTETYKGDFYCVKCKEKREAEGEVVVANGRKMAKGVCPVCSTKLNRILGKA